MAAIVAPLVPLVGAAAQAAIAQHFFNKKTDSVQDAVDKIMKRMQEVMHTLLDAGSAALLMQQGQAFSYTHHLLQNVEIAYAKSMNDTVEKADMVIQKALMQVATIVYGVIHGAGELELFKQVDEIKAVAKSVVALMNGKASLESAYPNFISSFPKRGAVKIGCTGFFPDAANPKLMPRLQIRGKVFECVRNFSPIEFAVPYELLFPSENHSLMPVGYTIKIPYFEGSSLCKRVRYQEYRNWLSILPDSPGKITLEYTAFKKEAEKKDISTFCSQSSKRVSCGGEARAIIDRGYQLPVESGWSIVPGSVSTPLHFLHGEKATYRIASEGPTFVNVVASTYLGTHHTRDSSHLEFHIRATVFRIQDVGARVIEELSLKWGESVEIPLVKKNWKVTLETFNGVTKTYNGVIDDTFISIMAPGGVPTLKIKETSKIFRDPIQGEPLIWAKL